LRTRAVTRAAEKSVASVCVHVWGFTLGVVDYRAVQEARENSSEKSLDDSV
jgi:hypothetical protein